MSKEMIKSMKQTLMCCAQGQMGHLESVDAKELGEVIDMIKDLSEAVYYCTITEAMEGDKKEHYERSCSEIQRELQNCRSKQRSILRLCFYLGRP